MDGLIRDTRNQPGLEVVPSLFPQDMKYNQPEIQEVQLPSTSSSRICGLATRTFWAMFALLLVLLGAAIGGGVAGGISAAHKDKSVSNPAQQQSTGFAYSPSSSSTTTTTTTTTSTSSSNAPFSSTSTSTGIPPSSTQPGIYRIINIDTNTAIDLLYGNTNNDTTVECWTWNATSTPADYAHQAWQIASVGNEAIVIFNTQANSYITAPDNLTAGVNPSSGAYAAVYGAVPGSPEDSNAQWVMVTNSDNSVSFWSKAYPTKFLDLAAGDSADGTPVILWEKNGGLNQEWRLVPS